jgi:polyvinyl alcohol dehydrogenase (cytochrome)
MKATRRNLHVLAIMTAGWLGVMGYVLTTTSQARGAAPAPARGQAPAPAANAPAPGGAGRGNQNPGTEEGIAQFELRCSVCHNNPALDLVPSANAVREMTPERILESVMTGSMKSYAEGLNDPTKRRIAEFMAGRPLGSSKAGNAATMPNKCPNNPAMSNLAAGMGWNGWSPDTSNTRAQTAAAAGLTAAQVPRLKLKWAFGFPTGESSNAQPTVVAGRVFVGSDNGYIYSLDAATGCVYWSFEGGSIVRGAVSVGPVTGQGTSRYAVYFGDGHANVFAVDAQNGKLLWKAKADSHWVARITSAPKLYNGKLFVPVSSSEEFRSGIATYPCCTSRGSVVAFDANNGKIIWKAWVTDQPKAYKVQSNGVVLYGPAGGAVWNTPTVDPVRNAVYFSTGDATAVPAPLTTDGVMAVDINTGKTLWAYQADANDIFMGGCGQPTSGEQCPNPNGPDLDIANSPILKSLPGGRRVLLVGTKRGHVIALDPDNNGAVLYRVLASTGAPAPATPPAGGGRGGGGGSIVWGGAADDQNVYYAAGRGAGLAALKLATGEKVWAFTGPPPAAAPGGAGAPAADSLGAAPTLIPGVVFQGSGNGKLYAVSTTDGKMLWEFNTAQEFSTVNKIPAHGGQIASTGAVISGGMLFIGSGYAISSGASGGNVLLAFSVE